MIETDGMRQSLPARMTGMAAKQTTSIGQTDKFAQIDRFFGRL
jgi:hypothetical protein